MLKTPKVPFHLAVCCLNISEGRNHLIVEAIANAAVKNQSEWKKDNNISSTLTSNDVDFKCKATVLSVYTDHVYNRGNITIAAPIEYLSTSVYQASLKALNNINLKDHLNPGHPRLGVVDLIPIHPVSSSVSLETCGIIARNVAKRIVDNVDGASAFLFGTADHNKRGLIERRKEINWFEMESDINVLTAPDLGKLSETYGLTGIGAIPYMSVLNVILDTNDLKIGRDIASKIRGANKLTGLPGIQTMALRKNEGVEIACNLDTNDLQSKVCLLCLL